MQPTTIEWTDYTANPLRARNLATGAIGHYCEVISPECAHCYAAAWNALSRADRGTSLPYRPSSLPHLELFLSQRVLDAVRRRRDPCKLFWCSMTDIALDEYEDEWVEEILRVVDLKPQVTHQLLTKRPERLRDLLARHYGDRPMPASLWVGVTAGTQKTADEWLPVLRQIPAAVRLVSAEPLLEPVWFDLTGVSWLIAGGESNVRGRSARPCDLKWLRHAVKQCRDAGASPFVKQLGDHVTDGPQLLEVPGKGKCIDEWPADLRVRQWPPLPASAASV